MRRSLRETLAIGTLVISLLSSRANAHDFVVDQQAVDFTFYNVVVSLRSGVIGQSFVPQHGSLDVVELHLSNREALMPFGACRSSHSSLAVRPHYRHQRRSRITLSGRP